MRIKSVANQKRCESKVLRIKSVANQKIKCESIVMRINSDANQKYWESKVMRIKNKMRIKSVANPK